MSNNLVCVARASRRDERLNVKRARAPAVLIPRQIDKRQSAFEFPGAQSAESPPEHRLSARADANSTSRRIKFAAYVHGRASPTAAAAAAAGGGERPAFQSRRRTRAGYFFQLRERARAEKKKAELTIIFDTPCIFSPVAGACPVLRSRHGRLADRLFSGAARTSRDGLLMRAV